MGLLKTLAIIFLIYYIFRIVGRYILPYLLKRFITKKQREFEGRMKDQQRQQQSRQEGEINIDYVPPAKGKSGKSPGDTGEYVDYEEME